MTPDFSPAVRALRQVVEQHGSQAAAAKALGISPVYLGDLLRGRRVFSDRVLAKLGLELVVRPVRDVDSPRRRR